MTELELHQQILIQKWQSKCCNYCSFELCILQSLWSKRINLLTFPSLTLSDTLPKVTGTSSGQRSEGKNVLQISCSRIMFFRKHSKHTNTSFKLIQMRAEDDKKWWQIQNPMLSPRRNTLEVMTIFMLFGRQRSTKIPIQISKWIIHTSKEFKELCKKMFVSCSNHKEI